jgi:hypothetical protein
MGVMRAEEKWVAECLEAILPGTSVVQHDDNSLNSMHDLDLHRDGERIGACEVTSAAEPTQIELWNLANGEGEVWKDRRLRHSWIVHVNPAICRYKKLRTDLPPVLRDLEQREVLNAGSRYPLRHPPRELARLGVTRAERFETKGDPAIFPLFDLPDEQDGGMVPSDANVLVAWLDQWINSPAQAHNATKLANSGARDRHLFVLFPGFSSAPFEVTACLMWGDVQVPTSPPRLPLGVTHLWAMTGWNAGRILQWAPTPGWTWLPKPGAEPLGSRSRS